MVYNTGQHVATTAMLYTILLGMLYKMGMSPIVAADIFGLMLHTTAGYLVYLILIRLTEWKRWAIAGALVFVSIPRLMWGALSGMEVPLYVFLVTLGIYWHVRYRWDEGPKSYLATLAFSLSALARPECAAFVILALAERFFAIRDREDKCRFTYTIPLHLLIMVLVLLPFVMFNYFSFNHPLPPAFYAKTIPLPVNSAFNRLLIGLSKVGNYIFQAFTACILDNILLTLAIIPGFIITLRIYRKSPASGIMILPIGMLGVPALTGLLARFGSTQLTYQTGRYSAYLVPMLVIMGVLGLMKVSDRLAVSVKSKKKAICIILLPLFCLLFLSDAVESQLFGWQVQNINAMQVELGKWAARLPEKTVIAVNDAGAIPFFSRHEIIDTVGVVNPEVIPYLRKYHNKDTGLMEYLEKRKPDYVIIFPSWYPRLCKRTDVLHPIMSVTLEYNVVCGGAKMVVYKTDWK